jgi:hypothetical protein
MNHADHVWTGVTAGYVFGLAAGARPGEVVVLAACAAITAAGATSPDVDQFKAWKRITGGKGLARHRGVTHWWAWPALAALGLEAHGTGGSMVPWAFLVGWCSHLFVDAIFGHSMPGCGGAGIPMGPASSYVSLSGGMFRSDGITAHVAAWVGCPGVLLLLSGGLRRR